jgi:hypothetical protein
MDTLHTVLRSINGTHNAENKSRRDHLVVFREFLDHLGRASRKKAAVKAKPAKSKSRRRR